MLMCKMKIRPQSNPTKGRVAQITNGRKRAFFEGSNHLRRTSKRIIGHFSASLFLDLNDDDLGNTPFRYDRISLFVLRKGVSIVSSELPSTQTCFGSQGVRLFSHARSCATAAPQYGADAEARQHPGCWLRDCGGGINFKVWSRATSDERKRLRTYRTVDS